MKIKLNLPSHIDHSLLKDGNLLELPEGSTLSDLFVMLNIPDKLQNRNICLVNGVRAELSACLKEGDYVAFFLVLAGG